MVFIFVAIAALLIGFTVWKRLKTEESERKSEETQQKAHIAAEEKSKLRQDKQVFEQKANLRRQAELDVIEAKEKIERNQREADLRRKIADRKAEEEKKKSEGQ